MLAVDASASVNLPLPSSPHWPPMMIVAVIVLVHGRDRFPVTRKRTTGWIRVVRHGRIHCRRWSGVVPELPQLAEQLALPFGQLGREADVDLRQQVALLVRL